MPFNGSGGFTALAPPNFPAVSGTTIVASYFNNVLNDVFTGLGQVVTRDGQSPWTANLPAGGFKVTGLGAASALGESVAFGQAAVTFGDLTTTGNTVLGDAATDTLNVGAGGLIKDASGNVGVGATPAAKLHILGSELRLQTGGALFSGYNTAGSQRSGYLQFSDSGIVSLVGEGVSSQLVLGTNGTSRLTISAVGDVGVGSVPPAGYKLDVAGTIRGTGGEATTGYGLRLLNAAGNGGASLTVPTGASSGLTISSDAGDLRLYSAGVERFAVTAAGSVLALTGDFRFLASSGSLNFYNTAGTVRNGYVTSDAGYVQLVAENAAVLGLGTAGIIHMSMSAAGATSFTGAVSAASFAGPLTGNVTGSVSGSAGSATTAGTVTTAAQPAITSVGTLTGLNLASSGSLNIATQITRYESSEQACPTTTTVVTVAHGGGRTPDIAYGVLRCKTSELGYTAGDEIAIDGDFSDSSRASTIHANTSSIALNYVGAGIQFAVRNLSTGALASVTAANWRVVFRAHWL